jgi:hypothetical protein
MSKKIMLLALAAVTAAMFAMPAAASATFESLHMSPTPAKLHVKGVGHATLRSEGGQNITCNGVSGTVTPEAGGTTGKLVLTFGPHCTGPTGETCVGTNPVAPSGSITTTTLPYHLVTLKGKTPGVLITPGTEDNKSFAHFNCNVFGFPVQTTVEGNGVLGTITAPACGGTSSTATLSFKSVGENSTTQLHRQVAGTTEGTIWSLSKGGNPAAQEAHATLTATNSTGGVVNTTLVCT